MGIVYSGNRNPNWRGGRIVSSNGYVMVRVGVDHHLADVRGYAYEHRLVAEQKIGQRLRDGEQVHHVNRDKKDNRPENIEVEESRAHHAVCHRRSKLPSRAARLPGEDNPVIECACGCGKTFEKYDAQRRARRYFGNHNSAKRGKDGRHDKN